MKEKFDEFDVGKTGLLKLDAARKCLDGLNKNKVDVMLPGAPGSIPQNGARAENPGTESGIQHNLCHVTYYTIQVLNVQLLYIHIIHTHTHTHTL